MRKRVCYWMTGILVPALFAGCVLDSSPTGVSSDNQAPTADAGPDRSVTDADGGGDESVLLDGSGSQDPDGTIASHVWTEGAEFLATGESPNVMLSVGAHTIILTVIDDAGATSRDEVVVTVVAAGENLPPTANAGPDKTVTDRDGSGDETVALDGSRSRDPDGSIASYVWAEGRREIGTGPRPGVSLPVGTHTITLTVTDDAGASATDTVVITVSAGGGGGGAISYSGDIQPYFDAHCTACHSGGGPAGVNLDSYANVMAGGNGGALVVPGNSGQGILVPKIQSGHKGAPHGTSIVQDLKDWIDAGAPNN